MKINLIILSLLMNVTAMASDAVLERAGGPRGEVRVIYSSCADGQGAHVFVPGKDDGEKFSVWFEKTTDKLRVFSIRNVRGDQSNPHSPILDIRECSDKAWDYGVALEKFSEGKSVELGLSSDVSVLVYYKKDFSVEAVFNDFKTNNEPSV